MKCISLICAECGKEFDKPKNEYNRRVKKGVDKFYCSIGCGALHNIKLPTSKLHPNPQHLIADNRRDEFTPFKWFIRRINLRAKKKNYNSDITVEYLSELWLKQNGICPITGWQLVLPHNCDYWPEDNPFGIRSASLDRIDNSIGYFKGNVRFVAVIANFARNKFDDKEVLEFAEAVVCYNKITSIEVI